MSTTKFEDNENPDVSVVSRLTVEKYPDHGVNTLRSCVQPIDSLMKHVFQFP